MRVIDGDGGVLLGSGFFVRGQVVRLGLWLGAVLLAAAVLSLPGCVTIPGQGGGATGSGDGEPVVAPQPMPDPSVVGPFEQGAVVAQNYSVYRVFIGGATSGGYIVQDFYVDTGAKKTDPYVMTRLAEVDSLLFEDTGKVVLEYRQLTESGIGIDGAYVQWYRSGGKAIEGAFDVNFPIGEWRLMYENGQPMLQDTWRDAVRNGVSKGWHENGSLAGEGEYMNNVRQGLWTVWYPNGVKMQEGFYDNGQQDGGWVFWFDNSAQKEAGAYVNGVRVGLWQWWTRDGVLAREAEYDELGNVKGMAAGSGRIQPRQ